MYPLAGWGWIRTPWQGGVRTYLGEYMSQGVRTPLRPPLEFWCFSRFLEMSGRDRGPARNGGVSSFVPVRAEFNAGFR